MHLEKYFSSFRENIVGINQTFISPFGEKRLFMLIGLLAEEYIKRLKKS